MDKYGSLCRGDKVVFKGTLKLEQEEPPRTAIGFRSRAVPPQFRAELIFDTQPEFRAGETLRFISLDKRETDMIVSRVREILDGELYIVIFHTNLEFTQKS